MNHEFLSPDVIVAAQQHAMSEYPKESCGLVVSGRYIPCENIAEDPTQNFEIAGSTYVAATEGDAVLEAVLHSHPDGPYFPTKSDMQGQLSTNVPWGIIATDGERAAVPNCWGDSLVVAPLIGRQFMHGIWDCYSIIRDCYRLGAEGLLAHDITGWPYEPHVLPEVARDDNWWEGDENLYADHFEPFGFERIPSSQARAGDLFFMKVRSDKMNHGGVLLDNQLILHHLPNRLSRREPAGIWAAHAEMWIRFRGANA